MIHYYLFITYVHTQIAFAFVSRNLFFKKKLFSIYNIWTTHGQFLGNPVWHFSLQSTVQSYGIQAECFSKPASQVETPHLHSLSTAPKQHVVSTRMIK